MKKVLVTGSLIIIALLALVAVPEELPTPPVDSPVPTDTGDGDPSRLPLLPAGQYLGWHTSFNASNPAVTRRALQDATRAAEANGGLLVDLRHFDWRSLEPRQGSYQLSEFEAYLKEMQAAGKHPLLFIPAIDSAGFQPPADLGEGDEKTLRDNRRFDDPEVIQRYNTLMDTVVPLAVAYGAWGIIVGNEPDGFIEDYPERAEEIVNFLTAVREHVTALDSRLGVAMVTTAAVEDPDTDPFIKKRIRAVTQAGSFAAYNVYCDHEVGGGETYAQVKARFDRLVEIAEDKHIVIQELGCSSGSTEFPTTWYMSEALQVRWLENIARILHDYSQVRAAFWFTLVDGEPAFYAYFDDLLMGELGEACSGDEACEEVFTAFVQNAKAAIATYGFIDYETGRTKPAFESYLRLIEQTAQ